MIRKKKVFLFILFLIIYQIYVRINIYLINPYIFIKIVSFEKKEPINPHNYMYIINPDESICKDKNLTLLAFVLTRRDNFIRRETIRKTWSNQTLFSQMRVVFMLGSSNDSQLDSKIKNESKIYGDIVQETFQDTYLNLTLKTIQGIKWVSEYCSKVKYVLKVDDDVLVNSYSLLNYLDNLKLETNNNLLCYFHVNSPVQRELNSKFYVSYSELNKTFYPKYCDGPAYMFQGNLAKMLYETSLHTKYFKFEDVYFGELASSLNLNFINLNSKSCFNYDIFQINHLFESKTINNKFFIYPLDTDILENTWSKIVNTYSN